MLASSEKNHPVVWIKAVRLWGSICIRSCHDYMIEKSQNGIFTLLSFMTFHIYESHKAITLLDKQTQKYPIGWFIYKITFYWITVKAQKLKKNLKTLKLLIYLSTNHIIISNTFTFLLSLNGYFSCAKDQTQTSHKHIYVCLLKLNIH